MNNNDNILFSQYFYLRGELENKSEEFFNMILSFLINCMEFRESPLKISSNNIKVDLLGIVVFPLSLNSNDSNFSIMYSVSDGFIHENRTMEGNLLFNSNNIELVGNISRFNEHGFIASTKLIQKYYLKSNSYLITYDYIGTLFYGKEYISNKEFYKVNEFKDEIVRQMKMGR